MTRKQAIEQLMRIGNPVSRVPVKGQKVDPIAVETIFSVYAAGQLVDFWAAAGMIKLDPEPLPKGW